MEEAVSIYEALNHLDEGTNQKLGVPVKRWIKSKTDQSMTDSFIDLGIALESLYLDHRTEELGFRLRLRAASLMKDVRKIYELRSQAVHQGVIKHSKENLSWMAKAQELCGKSIIKTIHHVRESGQLPNWERLEMGQLDEENTA